MAHPCADHDCDHCYSCDVLGVCCASGGSVQPDFSAKVSQRLLDAVLDESQQRPTLGALIRADQMAALLARSATDGLGTSARQFVAPASQQRALPSPAPDPNLITHQQKEYRHV